MNNLDTFLDGLPNADIERVAQALEHTTSGLMTVKLLNMHEMVLNALESREVINRCKRTGGYWRGEHFEKLQSYYNRNIQ